MAGRKKERGKGSRNVHGTTEAAQDKGVPLDAARLLAKLESQIQVIYGANDVTFDGLVGRKASEVREALTESFGIPADVVSFVNGERVDGDYILKTNDVLEFIRAASPKAFTA